ncbi:proline-rich acidic protein 1 [Mus pahari]|uniref:proline-rich acidic protein 1 n=1 Tax=Mus pahari TaxID=10093 RepID=UPI0011147E5F|nr:proline-rich acidic protein 1 [Mus pahari]
MGSCSIWKAMKSWRGEHGTSESSVRFLLATCLVAALLWEAGAAPAHQVPVIKTKGKQVFPEQETEKAWGIRAIEPLEKDNQLGPLLPEPKQKLAAAEEKRPDAMTWVETEDILSRLRNPLQGPEPDLDSIDHPTSDDVQDEEVSQSRPILYRQVLQGPEEDLDHIAHSLEDS